MKKVLLASVYAALLAASGAYAAEAAKSDDKSSTSKQAAASSVAPAKNQVAAPQVANQIKGEASKTHADAQSSKDSTKKN